MTKLYLMIQDLRFQRTWSRKKSRTPSRTAMQPLQWERVQKINPMITSKRICQTLRNQGPPFLSPIKYSVEFVSLTRISYSLSCRNEPNGFTTGVTFTHGRRAPLASPY